MPPYPLSAPCKLRIGFSPYWSSDGKIFATDMVDETKSFDC